MGTTVNLPKWLTRDDKTGTFVIDPAKAYPVILKELGLPIDQYSVETAYQCAKMKVQEIALALGVQGTVSIIVLGGDDNKANWALVKHPAGGGADRATLGREAKGHFERIRTRI